MTKNIVLSGLVFLLLGCAGASVEDVEREEPDLSQYGKIVVPPVNSTKFLEENVIFSESEELFSGVQHVTVVSHTEIHGYYNNSATATAEKELRVDMWLTAFEPEAGGGVPVVAPLDAAMEVAATEIADTGKHGVGIVVHYVELVDASTGEVLYFFDAIGEGQHESPTDRYSQAALSAAKDVIWRIERMSGRRLQPHRLPSHGAPAAE